MSDQVDRRTKIDEPMEVFASYGHSTSVKGLVTDPVCGMKVDPAKAATTFFSSVSVIGNALRLRQVTL